MQTITIYNPQPFNYYGNDIIWPDDATFNGCSNLEADTSITGAPIVNDNTCSMVAIYYEDKLFSVEEDACEKIVRTWTIRDWCQPNEIKWTHEQFIMLNNYVAPTFTSDCSDREVCVYGECRGLVELSASATDDCTPEDELAWRWKLDSDGDGNYDEFGIGNHFSKTMEIGTYEIAWIVEDKCGNQSFCNYQFTVKDCKNPTPYCISDLTTVVMNQAGMVTVKAIDFDHGSYDNCTPSNYGTCGCKTDLLFSFSKDVRDSIYTITCDSLVNGVARTFYLEMWVTDEAGNQDKCLIQLQVQDNNGVCPDTEGIEISGNLNKWKDDSPMKGVNVKLIDSGHEFIKYNDSGSNGKYEFNNVASGKTYNVEPQDDRSNCLSGITTLDIIKVQKHILGIKEFDSPYQYLAADANKSKSISAADILTIRKLILGIDDAFPNNKCWLYVDAKHQPSLSNPYNFNDKLHFTEITTSVNNANFKVVKVGDINDNHVPQQMPGGLSYRNSDFTTLELENLAYDKGEIVRVPVYIKSNKGIEGLQFTIDFSKNSLQFNSMESGELDINTNNMGLRYLDKGKITFSWNTAGDKEFDKNMAAFYMVFDAKSKGDVKASIKITGDITPAMSAIDDKEAKLKIEYRDNEKIADRFFVYQNTPNPFKNETIIRFNLPEQGVAELDIFDVTGKEVYKQSKEFNKGLSQFVIKSSDINSKGVFYYTISSKGNTSTKKMILIE